MQYYSTNNAIIYGYISSYLAKYDNTIQSAYGNGNINYRLPIQLQLASDTIDNINQIAPTDSNLPYCVNYLIALCGKYLNSAISIASGTGGGTVNKQTGLVQSITPYQLKFEVGDSSNTMVAGQTTLTIPVANYLSDSLSVFLDGNIMYSGATDQATYSFNYASNILTITFNIDGLGGGVQNGQKFIIEYATQSLSSQASSSISSLTPIDYIATGGETTLTFTQLIGRNVIIMFRGSMPIGQIITSGTPTGNQILFNSITGTITFASDYPLVANEQIKILYA